jgi:hypothetical protein
VVSASFRGRRWRPSPREGALDDPATGLHREADLTAMGSNDVDGHRRRLSDPSALAATVGADALDGRELTA